MILGQLIFDITGSSLGKKKKRRSISLMTQAFQPASFTFKYVGLLESVVSSILGRSSYGSLELGFCVDQCKAKTLFEKPLDYIINGKNPGGGGGCVGGPNSPMSVYM